jgi:hypothetical protein
MKRIALKIAGLDIQVVLTSAFKMETLVIFLMAVKFVKFADLCVVQL